MENDLLNTIWNKQDKFNLNNPESIIAKAKTQRRSQKATSLIISLTIVVLMIYAIYVSPTKWNSFSLGLLLMISSLVLRVVLEFGTMYHKQSQLIALDNKSYRTYLKRYYKLRLVINYYITPICVAVYIYGFYLLLPYFKKEFSEGFYTYIIISGVVSLLAIIAIIINTILKESRFLKHLKQQ